MQSQRTPVDIITFYHFVSHDADQIPSLQRELETRGREMGLRGLVIFGTEGINATICGEKSALEAYCRSVEKTLGIDQLVTKESHCEFAPFRRFKVRVREEIVTLGRPDILPKDRRYHLSPTEWDRVMREEDVLVIDTRNWYETQIGKFKGAVAPDIEEFQEFPEFVRKADIPKDKKILIYCTGGIRCEKAIVEMNEQGFENVYQLDGGILKYIEEFPNQQFEGECFVFDFRLALDQNLKPTQRYRMCPHCGQPSDTPINCENCDREAFACGTCLESSPRFHTCSKNCAHHYGNRLEEKKASLPEDAAQTNS